MALYDAGYQQTEEKNRSQHQQYPTYRQIVDSYLYQQIGYGCLQHGKQNKPAQDLTTGDQPSMNHCIKV